MSKYKTTEEHQKIFKNEVEKWINYFGLKSWKIDFGVDDLNDANSTVQFKDFAGVAKFTLTSTWDEEPSEELIKRIAFHEVFHLLLGKIDALAMTRFLNAEELNKELHAVIRTMENTIFKDLKI